MSDYNSIHSGQSLPYTGSDLATYLVAGLVLVLIGVGLLIQARRA